MAHFLNAIIFGAFRNTNAKQARNNYNTDTTRDNVSCSWKHLVIAQLTWSCFSTVSLFQITLSARTTLSTDKVLISSTKCLILLPQLDEVLPDMLLTPSMAVLQPDKDLLSSLTDSMDSILSRCIHSCSKNKSKAHNTAMQCSIWFVNLCSKFMYLVQAEPSVGPSRKEKGLR